MDNSGIVSLALPVCKDLIKGNPADGISQQRRHQSPPDHSAPEADFGQFRRSELQRSRGGGSQFPEPLDHGFRAHQHLRHPFRKNQHGLCSPHHQGDAGADGGRGQQKHLRSPAQQGARHLPGIAGLQLLPDFSDPSRKPPDQQPDPDSQQPDGKYDDRGPQQDGSPAAFLVQVDRLPWG